MSGPSEEHGTTEDRLAFPRSELRHRTARGGVINALFLGGAEVLVLVQGLIVTALLGPVAIGLYGIVTTTAITIVSLKQVGIDEAFVQQQEEGQEQEFQRAFTLELGLGFCFGVVIAAAAPLVALAYGDSQLLTLTLAVSYLPVAFALQAPTWIFFRRMDFLRQRLLQAVVPVATFCVTVPLAVLGVGVWSLVIGPFVGNALGAGIAIAVSPYRLRLRYERAALARYFAFSWPILAWAASLLVVQQGQILAFTLDGGLAAAGFITLAVTLTRYADRADRIVATTIYPAICALQGRREALEELFVKSNQATLMWVLPFCTGVVLFAPDLVGYVLGSRWDPAIVLLQGLAVAAGLNQLAYNWFSFYRAQGRTRPQAVESLLGVAAFGGLAVPLLFAFGSGGFVAGRVAGVLATLVLRRHYVRGIFPGMAVSRLVGRAAAPVLLAVFPPLALRAALWGGRSPGQAVAEIALFVAGLVAATLLLERGFVRELASTARSSALTGEALPQGEPAAHALP